jgi:integrase
MGPGRWIGYTKPVRGGAGSWHARYFNGEALQKFREASLGVADDYDEADGQVLLTYFQAQEKARAWFPKAHHEATGELLRKGPFTVADAMEAYMKDYERRGGKAADRTRKAWSANILPELGAILVEKLTRVRIEKWLEGLAASPKRTRKGTGKKFTKAVPEVAPTPRPAPEGDALRARKDSANRTLTYLKAALNHAKQRGLVLCSGDAWREVKPYRGVGAARLNFLSLEEQQKLVNACPPDFRNLVCGALYSGCRYGELIRVKVKDYDLKSEHLFIAESKSGKARQVPMTEVGAAFFKQMTQGRPAEELIFRKDSDDRRKDGLTGDPCAWGKSEQSRRLEMAVKAAGITRISFHELRHTYASHLVNSGVQLVFVADFLGHSGTRMVEKHYGHLCPSEKRDSLRKLGPKVDLHTDPKVQILKTSASA